MPGEPFFSCLVKTKSSTEELIRQIFALDKKSDTLTIDSLKDKCGNKSDMASWILKLMAQLQKNLKIMDEAISEVDLARQESKKSLKQVSELQQRLLSTELNEEKRNIVLGNVVEQKMESTSKQYSEAMLAGESENKITLSSIRNVVKQVVNTERIDRSKNVIIFGLEETTDGNTAKATEEILESIHLKPKIMSATRFGRTENDKIRPIRVTFEKSDTVHDVLKTSKTLKSTENFRNVYISVDRSAEQQARHKELVKTLNKKISEQPKRKWYIKNNQVRYDDNVEKLEDVTKIHQQSAKEPSPKKVTKPRPPFRRPGPVTARRPAYSPSPTDTDSD